VALGFVGNGSGSFCCPLRVHFTNRLAKGGYTTRIQLLKYPFRKGTKFEFYFTRAFCKMDDFSVGLRLTDDKIKDLACSGLKFAAVTAMVSKI
jgi:hypothetical protein